MFASTVHCTSLTLAVTLTLTLTLAVDTMYSLQSHSVMLSRCRRTWPATAPAATPARHRAPAAAPPSIAL